MEILAVIPARGGSKGIKRKNLRPILDKPLVAYSIEAGLNSKYITRTVVSSEDDEICEVSKNYGAQIIKRPNELAQDETKTIPVVIHALKYLEENEGYKPDYVVLLQPTCPLRDSKYIDDAFDFYFEKEKEGYDSCFSAFDIGTTHAKWKILHNGQAQGLYDYRVRPRRQDTAECIHRVKAIFPVSTSVKTVSTLENPKVLRDFSKVLTVFSHPNSAWEGECLAAARRWSSCVLLRHSACSALQLRRRQCLMGDNRGNILRRRTMYAGMRPPTITRVTAEIISAMP